jgi:hypothetical protein
LVVEEAEVVVEVVLVEVADQPPFDVLLVGVEEVEVAAYKQTFE